VLNYYGWFYGSTTILIVIYSVLLFFVHKEGYQKGEKGIFLIL